MRTPVAPLPRRASTISQCIDVALARLGRLASYCLVVALGGLLSASAAKWEPIDPADLALTSSPSTPGADAEILLSRLRLEQSRSVSGFSAGLEPGPEETVTEAFVRAKVYTAKGVEEQGKFSVEFPSASRVKDLEARVVKPDGGSVELTKTDYFESVVAKVGGEKWKKIAFTFPNLAPGDVVEYRWTTYNRANYWYTWFYCQEKLPVREFRFTVGDLNYKSQVFWLNCPTAKQTDEGGDFAIVANNIPAFEEEENMPPQREYRGWIFLIRVIPGYKPEDTWKLLSSSWAEEFAMATKPGSFFKAKAAEIIAGAATDEEKLRRLYDFCQSEVTNYSFVDSPELQAARDKLGKNDTPSPKKILERGAGWWLQINNLFAALARGAGYEVSQARNASKADLLTSNTAQGWAFLDRSCVAVKVGETWRYLDPGCHFSPFGMLNWRDEDVTVLQCDEDKLRFDRVPASPSELTQVQRKGRFTLDAEGTLEGDAEVAYTGHLAMERKESTKGQSMEDVNKDFRDEITARLPNAEVGEIVWTNLRTRVLPLTVKYQVKVPGYAEQAGKRLVFAPGFFAVGKRALFSSAERKYPILFPYAWGEHDDIEIVLPQGYSLDKPSAPAGVGAVASGFGATYKLQYNPKTRTFGFQRDFALGANGAFAFPVDRYPLLKGLFEELSKSDTHAIMLKPKAAPAAAAAATPSAVPAAQP